jgi:hypothetical protein
MTEHPTDRDYRNLEERNAAYWREQADKLAAALEGVMCYVNDTCVGHLVSGNRYEPVSIEMAVEDRDNARSALAEYNASK